MSLLYHDIKLNKKMVISPLIQPLASELLKIKFFIISVGISYSINLTFIFFPKS